VIEDQTFGQGLCFVGDWWSKTIQKPSRCHETKPLTEGQLAFQPVVFDHPQLIL
jgi:hypothetical protein